MAKFNDIASNQDMINIANAIRAVTRTTGKMTIPEMPERLWNIRVVETRDVLVDLTAGSSALLGEFETNIKHLFIVTPLTTADSALLAQAEAELQLAYDETSGKLEMSFANSVPGALAVAMKVVDLLLAQTDTSAGFLVNQATSGGSKIEPYDSTRDYALGDLFLLEGKLGITTEEHTAEVFDPAHSKLLATQIWSTTENRFVDFPEVIVNERSESQERVYSADYTNKNFAPLAFVQPYYAHTISETSASLSKTQPEPASSNVLTKQSSNTDYDWLHPDFVFTLTLDTGVVVSKRNTLMLNLAFVLSRNANISWGAKIKVSQDEGLTWTYISTAQAYGAQTYDASHGNMFSLTAAFDLLTELTTYGAGTKIAIEVFKKQANAASLTTTIHCGVIIDGAVINTTAQLVVANVVIDTAQLKDGSVVYSKLGDDVKSLIAGKQDKLTAGTGITIDNNNVISSNVDTSNLVTLDTTTQTFAGTKNFNIGLNALYLVDHENRQNNEPYNKISFQPNGKSITIRTRNNTYTSYQIEYIVYTKAGQPYAYYFPEKGGTFALTTDVDTAKAELQAQIGDIGTLLDTINGEVV